MKLSQENITKEILPCTDLFLYDLKHMNSDEHKKAVGVPNERIIENARHIARDGGKLQIRLPLITGFNDSDENIDALGKFCAGIGNAVTNVQILPYHKLGSVKYQRLDRTDPMPPCDPPAEETVRKIKIKLGSFGLYVTVH